MLKIVKNLSEYEKLYTDYIIQKKIRGVTNFFINQNMIPQYIAEVKVKYEVIDNTLFMLIDQGEFYRLYFCGLTSDIGKLPIVDKDVCCDIYEQQKDDVHIAFIHNLLLSRGFVCQQRYDQVRVFYGYLHKLASRYLGKYSRKLSNDGMIMKTVSIDDKTYVEKLIADNMGKYDGLSIEDDDWNEQVKNDNVVGLYVHEKLIAVYYFSTKAGRIIVDSNYRGRNLSVFLRMYFASQKRWESSTKNQYGWAEADNLPSKKTFEKLLAIYTGKRKYRYIYHFT
ncbi:hypothetical protein [uncultured Phascolarctobacterium sp.]|uniref:hypothetical protein n=1 Tax=uncultured Phascolarctobacterium sp. TaxID=512296 RepID=UPI002621DCD3|nr:hypothetical protein [uncultured Phascolarctobacterium sp.]